MKDAEAVVNVEQLWNFSLQRIKGCDGSLIRNVASCNETLKRAYKRVD